MSRLFRTVVIACLISCSACNRSSERPITCFAAASTIDAMSEVLEEHQRRTGQSVRVSYAASSALARLMLQGANADVFLSANRDWAAKVSESLSGARQVDLLSNQLVLIVPADSHTDITSLRQLADSSIRRIAIADPNSVPAGIYAKRLLSGQGLWESVKSRIAATADVRQTLALVEQGAAGAGLVYATDAASSRHVTIVARFPESEKHIVYPLLWVSKAEHPDQRVNDLVKFLQSADAAKIFERHGFISPLPRRMSKDREVGSK